VSITTIMGTGLSALAANQAAMKAVSTNVANVNTKGYSRLDVNFISREASGGVQGVEVEVTRIAHAYLAAAEMRGAADVASADILSQFMDRAQGLLGDPSDASTVFAALDPVFSSFGALAVDPASALRRSAALSDMTTMLNQLDTTAGEISALRDEANSRAIATMEEANSLMSGIARLNVSIQRSTIGGVSATEAATEQQRMLDRLSEIIDIRTQDRPLGGVEVRTTDGLLLVDLDSATIGVSSTSNGEAYPGTVMIAPRSTVETPLETHIHGGELKGLLRARDKELVDLQLSFGEFAAGAAEALNAAHNQTSAVPAPQTLAGRNTGLVGTDLLNFSGLTNIAVTSSGGDIVRNYRVDFGARTIVDDLGNSTSFANSVGDFAAQLNTAMGANGSASFANGVLTVGADTATNGVVITDDPTSPATRAGRGFSNTFGLNDVVTKGKPVNYATGLAGADNHNFSNGALTFAIRDPDGAITRTFNFNITANSSMTTLVGQLNTALTGYGSANLDATGRLTISPTNPAVGRIDVIRDTTVRGDTNLSMSDVFGLGETLPAERARTMKIRSDIRANPNLLGSAQADLWVNNAMVAPGTRVLAPGDGRGALVLEAAGATPRYFADAGGLTGQVTSVSDYAARLAGHAGVRAEALDAAKAAAESVRNEVKERREGEEGVNLDEELVKMTTYQQAYAAASRMITAARDMYDIVLNMV
jgi:flagellar hook-associated protein 1 FlgK